MVLLIDFQSPVSPLCTRKERNLNKYLGHILIFFSNLCGLYLQLCKFSYKCRYYYNFALLTFRNRFFIFYNLFYCKLYRVYLPV